MKNSGVIFSLVAIVVLFSCKKENEAWIQGDNLMADSAFAVQELKIVNQTSTEFTFELDLVKLNGANSEEIYADLNLSFNNGYYANTILSETVETASPISDYSTVALFQSNNTAYYEDEKMTFGLRRLFETIGQNPNKRIALVTRKKNENTITVHQEGTDPFDNSAAFNNTTFSELLLTQVSGPNNGSGEHFRDQMLAAIDLLNDCVNCTGQKSITIFDDTDGNYYPDFMSSDSVIEVAIVSGIQINVVTQFISSVYSDMAVQTGGFIITQREGSYIDGEPNSKVESLGILTQSLDAFLTKSLTKHHFTFTLSEAAGAVLLSGEFHSVNGIYDNNRFEIFFKVP
ncbi:MAG: hypothetical protein GQ574_09540 [Crocinitomix sp.]|nr:hypothetical protein [Crocinitomix sp.]